MTAAAAATGFWDWSLSAYRAPDVERSLLALQDAHALSVNILLWCAFIAERYARPEDIVLRKAIDLTAGWSRDVIGPIRTARRALGAPPRQAPADQALALREKLKAVELDAERIEQALLADLAASALAPRREPANGPAECRRLMARYAGLAGAVGKPGFSMLLLDELASALFPNAVETS